jgi:GT2 family glycosyltransferase
VRRGRTFSIAGCVGSRNPCASAPAQRVPPQDPEGARLQLQRPPHIRYALSACAWRVGRAENSQAGDRVIRRHPIGDRNRRYATVSAEHRAQATDDELAEHALAYVAQEILRCPDADLIYSDEDRIDLEGQRHPAFFKPDWNPALIRSQNYVGSLTVFRRMLVQELGGVRVQYEGVHEHDLVLRCSELSDSRRIRHIPRVLYHRRLSTHDWKNRNDCLSSSRGVRVIEDHLARLGIKGRVRATSGKQYRVHYALRKPLPRVSIIIPSACKPHVASCVRRLLNVTTYGHFELLFVIDEGDAQHIEPGGSLDWIASDARVRILIYNRRPFNFPFAINWGAKRATGSIFCLMNDDVAIITPDWLERLVARAQLEGVGATGPILYYPDDTIQQAGVILGIHGVAAHAFVGLQRGSPGYFGRAAAEQDLSCITGACIVTGREAFEKLGGFDERFEIALNDVDFCIRMRSAGLRLIWTPEVEMYHYESISTGKHDSPDRMAQFTLAKDLLQQRWAPILGTDPFYNPNLSLTFPMYTPAFPPRVEVG